MPLPSFQTAPTPRGASRLNILIALMLVGGAAMLALIYVVDRRNALDYTLLFADSKGLQPGAPVKLQGQEVGRVYDVTFIEEPGSERVVAVKVRLFPEHRGRVHAPPDTTARIRTQGIVFREPYVDVVNRGAVGRPIDAGATVRGVEGWTAEKVWKSRGAIGQGYAAVLERGRSQLDKLEEWSHSEQGEALRAEIDATLAALDGFASSTSETAQSQLERALSAGRGLLVRMRSDAANGDDLAISPEEIEALLEDLRREAADALAGESAAATEPDSGGGG